MPAPVPQMLTTPSIGTLGGVSLYNGSAEELSIEVVGQYRTDIQGTGHADVVRQRRTWGITCSLITEAQFAALDQVRINAQGGAVALHLNSVGADVFVFLHDWQVPRVGESHRKLTFTAEEV